MGQEVSNQQLLVLIKGGKRTNKIYPLYKDTEFCIYHVFPETTV